MIKIIRTFIGTCFLYIASLILPQFSEEKKEEIKSDDENEEPEAKVKKIVSTPVPFKDLNSYVEHLKQPTDEAAACMSICQQLKDMSATRKGPVRLSFSVTNHHDKDENVTTSTRSSIGAYKDKRWQRLKELNVNPNAILNLVEEMIEVMAQEGWGCMNDSFEQVNRYLSKSIKSNQAYVVNRCKILGVNGTIRLDVFIVVDVNSKRDKSQASLLPHIRTSITVQIGKEQPIESALYVYFNRAQSLTVRNPT